MKIDSELLLKEGMYDSMDIDDLETLVERVKKEMQKKEILKQYDIKQFKSGASKGTWYVKINGRKIQRASKTELEEKIVKIHTGNIPSASKTFKAIYKLSQEDRLKRIKDANKLIQAKETNDVHDRYYRRYIELSTLEMLQIDKITDDDIVEFLDNVIKCNNIKKKAFGNILTDLNQTFKYALKKKLIKLNPMQSVCLDDYKDSFSPSAPIALRGYTADEMNAMYNETRKMQLEQPEDARWWSYEFNLLTAERRAEIPPIKWSDVYLDRGIIDIHQQIIGKEPYTIIPSTKTGLERYFPIGEMLQDFLERLKANNAIYHPDSEFLFPDETKPLGCITPHVTYRAHRKICKKLNVPVDKDVIRGTHAFRRVHQTSFIEEGGSQELAAKIYGNSPETMERNYILKINSSLSAPIIDKTHEKLFKIKDSRDF